MRTTLALIGIWFMAGIANMPCQAQESSPDQFLDEYWTCTQEIIPSALNHEMYYFTPEGRFYFKRIWSSGTYVTICSAGTYRYTPSDGQITLHVQESYQRGHVEREPDFTESWQTLHILTITDSVAVVEVPQRIPGLVCDKEFHRHPCTSADMFALPGIEQIVEVTGIKVRKGHAAYVSVDDSDLAEVLEIIKSARYDRLNNGNAEDGAPMGNDYTVVLLCGLSDGMVEIRINESTKSRIRLGSWWYEIGGTAGGRLMELLGRGNTP